ncbi:MAG TPA: glycosyltransferase [Solirubrobacterales bacterium]|nr:glycosyltransferase [Solirubrobacterales bacterium]
MRDLSLVFPAYNEEARLPALLATLAGSAEEDLAGARLRLREIVIVDDGSSDRTSELVSDAAVRDPRIRPLRPYSEHCGKGAALKAGIEAATAELTLLADVDLSTPLSDAWRLSEAMREGGEPIAIGSRNVEGAMVIAPRYRRVLGAGFNLAVRALTGLRFADTQSGLKLLETGVARELVREQLTPGFACDVELLLRARMAGHPVVEVPVSYVHDDGSKLRVAPSSVAMTRDVLRMSIRLRRAGRGGRRIRRLEGASRA